MAETLNTYVLKVQKECDDSSTNAQSVIQQDVIEIYQEIMLQAYQYLVNSTYEDIPGVVGTQIYTPTASFTDVFGVSYLPVGSTDYSKLRPMSYDDYLNHYLDTSNGRPSKFVVRGSQIILDRPASEAYTLRMFYQPVVTELSGTSLIPDRYTNVVKLGASYKYFAFDDNPKAVEYKGLYEEALRNMILQLSTQQKPVAPKFFGV